MRALGRQIVKKVDSKGNRISNFKLWYKKHKGEVYFDSHPEWEVWKYLTDNKVKHTFHPKSIELLPAITTYEFKTPRRTKKAVREGRTDPEIKQVVQRKMEYTPDFYLEDLDTYIEVKGFADEQFKLRWKLFKAKGYKGFIVYSLNEFKLLYKQLKAVDSKK